MMIPSKHSRPGTVTDRHFEELFSYVGVYDRNGTDKAFQIYGAAASKPAENIESNTTSDWDGTDARNSQAS